MGNYKTKYTVMRDLLKAFRLGACSEYTKGAGDIQTKTNLTKENCEGGEGGDKVLGTKMSWFLY